MAKSDTTGPTVRATTMELSPEYWDTLVQALRLLESADSRREAVWFGPEDRAKLSHIREEIENQR